MVPMRIDRMKRLVIYFHYDAQGLLDGPCRFAVEALLSLAEVFLVTNGTLRQDDHVWAAEHNVQVLERDNVGLDVGAYRQALLTLGREQVASYDELVLMNYTLAGPVCPLEKMFREMEQRNTLDFWGLTRHYAMQSRRFGGSVPEHLQSHFLAVRQPMMRQDAFWEYWEQMKLPQSYEESIICHETRFTDYFEKQGFVWDSYVQTEDLKAIFVNPIMACPRELVEHRACPFFKRRSFFTPYEDELRRTDGNAAKDLYEYLSRETDYPIDDLIRALLKDHTLSAMGKNMHWHYLLPCAEKTAPEPWEESDLCLIRFEIPVCDAVSQWYLQQSAEQAEKQLLQIKDLFRRFPMLGVAAPELPLWPQAIRVNYTQWEKDYTWLKHQVTVPLDNEPPLPLLAGWVLVRKAAFPEGIPAVSNIRDAWLLPLQAQQNGYYSATFESCAQAAARTEPYTAGVLKSGEIGSVAKQLGRLIKHKILR